MKNHRIEKTIELKAPVSRVWQALTDYRQFSQWFGVTLEGPFEIGKVARGQLTIAGCDHILLELVVTKIEPENYFAYTWHPYPFDTAVDYSKEIPTLVEFRLEAQEGGTLLVVVESGFDQVPANRRLEAFRMNSGGWISQLENIKEYVEKA